MKKNYRIQTFFGFFSGFFSDILTWTPFHLHTTLQDIFLWIVLYTLSMKTSSFQFRLISFLFWTRGKSSKNQNFINYWTFLTNIRKFPKNCRNSKKLSNVTGDKLLQTKTVPSILNARTQWDQKYKISETYIFFENSTWQKLKSYS